MQREKTILHINPDDFIISLLRNKDPSLKNKPIVIANPSPRSPIISASYEARKQGIKPSMNVSQAKKICKKIKIIPPEWNYFYKASNHFIKILNSYSPAIEQNSIDEAFIDYTGCEKLFGNPLDFATKLRNRLKFELNVTTSIGISTSKVVSHIASKKAKTNNIFDIFNGYENKFLAPLPIDIIPYLPKTIIKHLKLLSIKKINDLLKFPLEILQTVFGYWGKKLYYWARGIDTSPFKPNINIKNLSWFYLLKTDILYSEPLQQQLYIFTEKVGRDLREKHLCVSKIELSIIYSDGVEKSLSATLSPPTNIDWFLFPELLKMFDKLYFRRVRVSAFKITAKRLSPQLHQNTLFHLNRELKMAKLFNTIDKIRNLYPNNSKILSTARTFIKYSDFDPLLSTREK